MSLRCSDEVVGFCYFGAEARVHGQEAQDGTIDIGGAYAPISSARVSPAKSCRSSWTSLATGSCPSASGLPSPASTRGPRASASPQVSESSTLRRTRARVPGARAAVVEGEVEPGWSHHWREGGPMSLAELQGGWVPCPWRATPASALSEGAVPGAAVVPDLCTPRSRSQSWPTWSLSNRHGCLPVSHPIGRRQRTACTSPAGSKSARKQPGQWHHPSQGRGGRRGDITE